MSQPMFTKAATTEESDHDDVVEQSRAKFQIRSQSGCNVWYCLLAFLGCLILCLYVAEFSFQISKTDNREFDRLIDRFLNETKSLA